MKFRAEVDDALEVEVGGVLDATRVIVACRCRNADAVDGVNMVFGHQSFDLIANI